ncbi:MAG: flagellar protein FlaG [Methylophaga sp.]|nr:flagellar protein FlaG [Methylophaga sp.]
MDMENINSNLSPPAKTAAGDFVLKTPATQVIQSANKSVSTQESKPEAAVSQEELTAAVASINDFAQNLQRSLQFSIDEGSGRNVVTVLDKQTEEIIRQFPAEEVLAFARRIVEQQEDTINLFSSEA